MIVLGRILAAAIAFASAVALAQPVSGPSMTAQLIVKFRDDATKALMPAPERVARLGLATGKALRHLRPMALGAHVVGLERMMTVAEASTIAAALARDPDVEYAEPDQLRTAQYRPNDELINGQTYLPDGPASINSFGAWDLTTGNPNNVVAVLDTGYRPHAGMAGRFLAGYDFISSAAAANDGNGRDANAQDPGDFVTQADLDGPLRGSGCPIDASSWHGTMTASVIGANGDDRSWTAGIDWSARILPVRVLGKCGGFDSDIADGLVWAGGVAVLGAPVNPTPAQVINLSLGGDGACPTIYRSAIAAIFARGVTRAIVATAGNGNTDAGAHAPGNCPNVITVAAINSRGRKASYSNFGAAVTIAAPGGDFGLQVELMPVLSNSGLTTPVADSLAFVAGTSFAAPVVSGVASLVMSVAPAITPEQLRAVLVGSVKPFAADSDCTTAICGAGIVDANAAVRAAMALAETAVTQDVIEYYNQALDHYFITPLASEIAVLDAGVAIKGWARTGQTFKANALTPGGTNPVCRFLIPPAHGDSHFFSADPAECSRILAFSTPGSPTFDKNYSGYILESSAFFNMGLPNAFFGICLPGQKLVYRLWNTRVDSNHRYTTDPAVRDDMIARGYMIEGYGPGPNPPIMCAPG